MQSILKNRRVMAVLGVIAAIGVVTAAIAYWSASGSGTGSASSSAGTSNLSLSQTSTLSAMYPGDSAQTLSVSVTNNASNSAYVTSVTASIASVTKAQGVTGTCDSSDYTLASPTMTVGQDIAAGQSATATGATIKFNNKATNQDACKGATVNLSYAIS